MSFGALGQELQHKNLYFVTFRRIHFNIIREAKFDTFL